MCDEMYGMAESTTHIVVRNLYAIIKKHLKPW
jgi:hypothetical protein